MKRSVLVLTMASFLGGCVIYVDSARGDVGWGERDLSHKTRTLTLSGADLTELSVDTGAGSLEIIGEAGRTEIAVTAEVYYHEAESIRLTLHRNGEQGVFVADFDSSSYGNNNARIDATVRVPESFHLNVDDGSGSIDIQGVRADMRIEDGSGSMTIVGGRNVRIDDGSGGITVRDLSGNLDIEDGSGSMEIDRIAGAVTIDDGSGDIKVGTVGSLRIIESGSGRVNIQ
ncbi:hypothetical protein J6I75_08060 [Pseudidiomarina sp. 1APP75-27a]|uniref:hypothetical protein n=1 Tax=Pseudidiomarina terrestris TaxID=2820060 RepID=UPI002B056833|nr:hypothetical protein [Pseudidiomarina sp. 1APP75-27a]MEA3588308.1 hypothetical protein [Pseudidiomarina sp. 1APP75-27a]